ncbi:tRNA-dihydrouridine(20) synthase [NAD(P)+]-like [Gonapodya sp. JEL0774]|nr:tRNA-dihydrouridine(20) synthase [NAD(P)+]-like [Gonapodya sp. JEL0774]
MWEPTQYYRKVILAPMVRVGTLPFRLLALANGADVCYGPEEIDRKIAGWQRVVNTKLRTVDFVNPKSLVTDFRIHSLVEAPHKRNFVFQMGTSDPEWAVKAARVLENDVSAIDVNCGCPKHFSVSGGMGAVLLEDPDKLEKILTSLVQNFPHLAITCKIRCVRLRVFGTTTTLVLNKPLRIVSVYSLSLLPNIPSTIPLFLRLQRTGISAIGVHFRTRHERPANKAHWEMVREILKVAEIPVIVNGDIFGWESVRDVRELVFAGLAFEEQERMKTHGADGAEDSSEILEKLDRLSYMAARGAVDNPTVFRELKAYLSHINYADSVVDARSPPTSTELLPPATFIPPPLLTSVEAARLYVRLASYFEHPGHPQVKYTLGQMVPSHAPRKELGTWAEQENAGAIAGYMNGLGALHVSAPGPRELRHEALRDLSVNADTMAVEAGSEPPLSSPPDKEKEKPKEKDTIAAVMYSSRSLREVCSAFLDETWYDKMVERKAKMAGDGCDEWITEEEADEARRLVQWVSRQGAA